jgi:hypothetical protein
MKTQLVCVHRGGGERGRDKGASLCKRRPNQSHRQCGPGTTRMGTTLGGTPLTHLPLLDLLSTRDETRVATPAMSGRRMGTARTLTNRRFSVGGTNLSQVLSYG